MNESELPGATLRRWAARCSSKRGAGAPPPRAADDADDGDDDGSGSGDGEAAFRVASLSSSSSSSSISLSGAWSSELPLELLEISWCDDVKEDDVAALVAVCPQLRSLDVQCVPLSDKLPTALALHCTALRRWNAARCDGIGDDGLRALVRGCPHLEWISVAWSMGVSNAGVDALLRGGARLRNVVLEGCKAIESDGLLDIALHAAARFHLQLLDLRWVNSVDADLARQLATALPFTCVVDYYETEHRYATPPRHS
jgi:hypothetical protein